MSRQKPSRLSATDLFCGAGGSSIGAEAAGVSLVMGINHWVRDGQAVTPPVLEWIVARVVESLR